MLSGCSTVGYYAQSINGELNILAKRQSISQLIQSKDISPELKQKLTTVLRIREFSTRQLDLPDNGSYLSYVDLHRPYVVWNVFAAPEFTLELKKWCFLFAGCVGYRGYFSQQEALEFAKSMQAKGYDVYVGGVDAYSTLGWFDDPLLSTVIKYDDVHLAGLIFHELAHQKIYIKNDTAFNEGYAHTVELEGIKRWMVFNGTPGMDSKYQESTRRRKDFVKLITGTGEKLKQLYSSQLPDVIKKNRKEQIFHAMRSEYLHIKEQQWGGYSGYDAWFSDDLNNAKLLSITTYTDYVPAFKALFKNENENFKKFFAAVREIGELPEAERKKRLDQLLIQAKNQHQ